MLCTTLFLLIVSHCPFLSYELLVLWNEIFERNRQQNTCLAILWENSQNKVGREFVKSNDFAVFDPKFQDPGIDFECFSGIEVDTRYLV